ncbi:MAG: hypothetical protein ACP6IP_01025 [Candidatus Njordarchaeia archaeon]
MGGVNEELYRRNTGNHERKNLNEVREHRKKLPKLSFSPSKWIREERYK